MALSLTFLTSTDCQYFTGHSCDNGETLLQIPVSTTDKDSAKAEAVTALMTELNNLGEDVAQGYSDLQIRACFQAAVDATNLYNVYVDAPELGVDLEADPDTFEDLYSYWVLSVTYDIRLTYDLVLHNTESNGGTDDTGFFMADCGDCNHGDSEDAINNPLGLDVYSFPANGHISPPAELSHHLTIDDINTLYYAAAWHIDGNYLTTETEFATAVVALAAHSYPSIYSDSVIKNAYNLAETTFAIHGDK
jgi:hypothetical protein